MGSNVAPALTNFNAGELSPLLDGRVDMARYANGCSRLRNFLPLPQGPVRRRSGTRFVAATKNNAHRSWLAKFVFSVVDTFILEFGDRYIRFFADNGQVLIAPPPAWDAAIAYVQGDLVSRLGINYYAKIANTNQQPPNLTFWHPLTGNIFEISSPYAVTDLTDTDGTFRLDMEPTGDVIFITHPNFFPQKLSRFTNTRWTIVDADIKNGPFVGSDPDEMRTVFASAATGTITLTASASIFTSAMVNTLFLLEQKTIDGYAVWEVAKMITVGLERRSDSNVYRALTAGETGTVRPTHREGARFDGDPGVQWEYVHSGYGIVRITAANGTTATATVLLEIPSQSVGVANASTRWSFSEWRSDIGFPGLVKIFRERLCFTRGQEVWGSVAGDLENLAERDGAEVLPDSAFNIEIGSSETNAATWMVPADALLIGTRGAEFSVSEISIADVFGPGNIKADEETSYGARQVPPARVGESVLFVQPSGRRMRDQRFAIGIDGYDATDLMVLSEHIARGQIIQLAFALEPHSIMWAALNNGNLIGLTYLLEQEVQGWHPHDIGGNGRVESIQVIPSPDGLHDQLWMQVRRTINGQTRRYIEFMESDWIQDEDALEDAFFSDSGLTFDGLIVGGTARINPANNFSAEFSGTVTLNFTPVVADVDDYLVLRALNGDEAVVQVTAATNPAPVVFITLIPVSLQNVLTNNVRWARDIIGGIEHLEGQEVTITVNGAAHPRRTVVNGQVILQERATKVQLGLPCDVELITMRVEAGSATGTAQGKIKRIHQCTFRVHETLGGQAGPQGGADDFEFRSDEDLMDQPPPVVTGDFTIPYPEGYTTDARIRVFSDQPLPITVVGIYPQMVVEDRR